MYYFPVIVLIDEITSEFLFLYYILRDYSKRGHSKHSLPNVLKSGAPTHLKLKTKDPKIS